MDSNNIKINQTGCDCCQKGKIINTNGTDFKICHFTELGKDEHFIQTITDSGEYHSLDIKYCPLCGKPLFLSIEENQKEQAMKLFEITYRKYDDNNCYLTIGENSDTEQTILKRELSKPEWNNTTGLYFMHAREIKQVNGHNIQVNAIQEKVN